MQPVNMPERKQEVEKKEKLKVLVADDDVPTRILLRAAITQWGYDVIEARDGEDAWEILQGKEAPRLLILDWEMPKLDGIALCSRVKRELNSQYIYIILLTQLSETANIVKGVEAGADEFLPKPFNMAELRTRLSVGTRLVQDESKLAEQNKQLEAYTSYVEILNTIALNIAQQIEEAEVIFSASKKDTQDALCLQKIEELRKSAKSITEAIESFRSSQKSLTSIW